jgi:hypothetical protein
LSEAIFLDAAPRIVGVVRRYCAPTTWPTTCPGRIKTILPRKYGSRRPKASLEPAANPQTEPKGLSPWRCRQCRCACTTGRALPTCPQQSSSRRRRTSSRDSSLTPRLRRCQKPDSQNASPGATSIGMVGDTISGILGEIKSEITGRDHRNPHQHPLRSRRSSWDLIRRVWSAPVAKGRISILGARSGGDTFLKLRCERLRVARCSGGFAQSWSSFSDLADI